MTLPAAAEPEPLVSVILPVHNGQRFVAETIDSVLRQTYHNLEIIVVDDGSTDLTYSVVQRLALGDSRIRLIRQANAGVARARNRGLAEARGGFVAPLDADDLWDPVKIEHQVRRIQQAGEGTGFVYCWWVWINEQGLILDRSPEWMVEGDAHDLLLQVNYTGNASVPLYRRRCLEEVGGYDESMERRGGRGCEDWDVALKVAARSAVAVVPELLVGYRRLPDSMSTQSEVMWRSRQLLTERTAGDRPEIDASLLQRSADQFALYISGVLFRCGDYFHSFLWALRAWRTGLVFKVLPYVLLVFIRRLWLRGASPHQTMTSGSSLNADAIPRALIPYDRIYGVGRRTAGAAGRRRTLLTSPVLQIALLTASFLFVWWLHRENDGLWFQGDAPRHAANGLFWYDLATARTANWKDFALRYYARYPVINPVTYPPLFYLLEGLVFRVSGASPQAAKLLVVGFGIMAGWYTILWARRWIGELAGWAGALLAFTPGMVAWSNTVMLNVPAVALGMACLYYARRWLEAGGRRELIACSLFALATFLTYYQGVIVIPVVLVWTVLWRRAGRKRASHWLSLTAIGALVSVPVLAARLFAPRFLERNLPSLATLTRPDTASYYPLALPGILGPVVLVLGALGLGIGALTPQWRQEAKITGAWIITTIAIFSLFPARDPRYILILVPAFVLSLMIGLAALGNLTSTGSRYWTAAFLLLVLLASAFQGARMQIPLKSGFRAAASYISSHAGSDNILYDGYHDGLFGFYFRVFDPHYDRRLVLGQELLYHYGPGGSYNWIERLDAASAERMSKLLRNESGCRWIALEIGPYSEWAQGQKILREAVRGPQFEFVRSFPVTAPNAERIDLYRQVGPIRAVTEANVRVISFTEHYFKNVQPISR